MQGEPELSTRRSPFGVIATLRYKMARARVSKRSPCTLNIDLGDEMPRLIFVLIILLGVACAPTTKSSSSSIEKLNASTASVEWYKGNRVSLDWTNDPRANQSGTWSFIIQDGGESSTAKAEQRFRGIKIVSDFLVYKGQLLVIKQLEPKESPPYDNLQYGTLMLGVLEDLLSRAVPGGPGALATKQKIDFGDSTMPFITHRNDGLGSYGAPWTVTGSVSPQANGAIGFELEFSFTLKDGPHAGTFVHQKFKGSWQSDSLTKITLTDEDLIRYPTYSLRCLMEPVVGKKTVADALMESGKCR